MGYFIFLLLPLSSIAFLFIRSKKRSTFIVDFLFVLNAIIYLFPVFQMISKVSKGQATWDQETKFWLLVDYITIFSICAAVQFILIIIKIALVTNPVKEKSS